MHADDNSVKETNLIEITNAPSVLEGPLDLVLFCSNF
jgi:hypothetical protein